MAIPTGELTKMTIESYGTLEDAESGNKKLGQFQVFFNPTTYNMKFEVEFDPKGGAGATAVQQRFKRIKPRDFSFEFLFDGTGATLPPNTEKPIVANQIQDFMTLTGFLSETHMTSILKIVWGKLSVNCVLKVADIAYTLFDKDGSPLRAKIRADFTESVREEKRNKKEKKQSPDMTHSRLAHVGDKLPLLCYDIYGDAIYYLHVANFNNLKNYRHLVEGQEILFPPLQILNQNSI